MSTLSVIMTNYNHGHLIEDALQAILEQSLKPTEVVVIDDGSTDNSVQVIQKIVKRYPIIRFYRSRKNRGAIHAANRALKLTTGEYVYAAAADDRVRPGLFKKSMSLLSRHPEAGLCCSNPGTFDDKSGLVFDNPMHWSKKARYFSPEDLAELIAGWYIAGHTCIAKRSAMMEVGGFRPELNWHCDWFLWLVIAFRYGICYIPETLATFRTGVDSYSSVGEADPIRQPETLSNLLHLLKSERFRDVLPYFVRGAVFTHFTRAIVRTVMSRPEHWDIETLMLILFPLYQWGSEITVARQVFQGVLAENLKDKMIRLTPRIIRLCKKDKIKRVYFYGAGSHTRAFLPMWEQKKGPKVAGIIVSKPPTKRKFLNLPVIPAKECRPKPGDAIVLSSESFEKQMAATCKKNWPDVPFYAIYQPNWKSIQ